MIEYAFLMFSVIVMYLGTYLLIDIFFRPVIFCEFLLFSKIQKKKKKEKKTVHWNYLHLIS